jgi:hypothetical protein
MTRTMQRAVALFAALALASVWHADATCATTQTFKQLQPSVRAWKKDTFSNVAHDTPILEGTTPRVAERVSRTGLPTLTSYPLLLSPSAAQQTGLGTDPYEVEWIATQNGKVRARIEKEPRRLSGARRRGKKLLTRPRASQRRL